MRLRTATARRPFRMQAAGVTALLLTGIDVRTCRRCGGESPLIPKHTELLNTMVAAFLGQSGRLRGDQIRFVRRHAEIPSGRFAALLGVTHTYLSRIEHGKAQASPTLDRLVRAQVDLILGTRHAASVLLDAVGLADPPAVLRFDFDGSTWSRAEPAGAKRATA